MDELVGLECLGDLSTIEIGDFYFFFLMMH